MSGKKCAALLILLGLLTGCGEQSDPGIPPEAPNSSFQQDSERTQLEASASAQSAAEPRIHGLDSAEDSTDSTAENQMESGTADTDALEEEAAVLGDFSECSESISLYENEKVSVVLLPVQNIEDGSPELYVQVENYAQESISVSINNCTADGVELHGWFSAKVAPGQRQQDDWIHFEARLNAISQEEEIICELQIKEEGMLGDVIADQQVRFPIPTEFYAGCLSFLGAKAEEQVLMDNDRGRITLMECGGYPEDYKQEFGGMVCFENQTQQELNFKITKVRLNGMILQPSSKFHFTNLADGDALPPGYSRIEMFTVSEYELDKAGITSITSVELLIVDGMQIRGGNGESEDGTWYPITLSSTGAQQENQQDIDGTVLMSADGITVYYLQNETAKWTRSGWKVPICVVNDSNQDIYVDFQCEYYCDDMEVSAQNTATKMIQFQFPLGQPVTASATIYTLNRDKLLIPAQEFTIPGL